MMGHFNFSLSFPLTNNSAGTHFVRVSLSLEYIKEYKSLGLGCAHRQLHYVVPKVFSKIESFYQLMLPSAVDESSCCFPSSLTFVIVRL